MRLSKSEQRTIFDQALRNHQAIVLDWKFPIEDIVFNVKQVLPELNIDDKGEKQLKGNWLQTMVLDGKEYAFKTDSNTLILDVIYAINEHLKKDNQILVFFDAKDDDYCFILINLSELPSYLEKGFIEI